MLKTSVMKNLEQNKIAYTAYEYDPSITEGLRVASILGLDHNKVFKTLVTTDNKDNYFVFVIPVTKELNLKMIAKALNKKSIDMIKQKDLEPLTGYVHGGCSPIGMKKKLPTYYDDSINNYEEIYVSAGRVGVQIKINAKVLITYTLGKVMKLT